MKKDIDNFSSESKQETSQNFAKYKEKEEYMTKIGLLQIKNKNSEENFKIQNERQEPAMNLIRERVADLKRNLEQKEQQNIFAENSRKTNQSKRAECRDLEDRISGLKSRIQEQADILKAMPQATFTTNEPVGDPDVPIPGIGNCFKCKTAVSYYFIS